MNPTATKQPTMIRLNDTSSLRVSAQRMQPATVPHTSGRKEASALIPNDTPITDSQMMQVASTPSPNHDSSLFAGPPQDADHPDETRSKEYAALVVCDGRVTIYGDQRWPVGSIDARLRRSC
jgi:hypothetical protein